MLERLQKIISAAGVTSRRAAEELIAEGRVRVNGKVVTEAGSKADPSKDHIKVDGKLINPHQPPTYILLNKPAGYVTTMSDPEGRATVNDLLKGVKTRVYPVGRLDYNTEGLLILTNDGDFAHLITHPRHEFPKTYLAKVKGVLEERQIEMLENGVFLQDGKTAPARVRKIRKEEANSWVEITIHEGRKRQVRRMFDHVGRSVIKLKRTRTGSLSVGNLPEGTYRHLTLDEVNALRETAMKTDDSGQQVRVYKPVVKTPKADESSERRIVDEGPGPELKARQAGHKETATGFGSRGTGRRQPDYRAQRIGEGRVRRLGATVTKDTREGLRKNQTSRPIQSKRPEPGSSGRSQSKEFFAPRAVSSPRPDAARKFSEGTRRAGPGRTRPEERGARSTGYKPQGERAYGAGARPAARRPAPAAGRVAWKSEDRSKPVSGSGSRGPRKGTGYKPQGERTYGAAAKPTARRPAPAAGGRSWKSEDRSRPVRGSSSRGPREGTSYKPQGERIYGTGAKPAARRPPAAGRGAWKSESRSKPGFSSKGTREGASFEGRRPGSGPRPNKSPFTGSKGPARGVRPGSKGRGQGASNRGPRR